MRPERFASIVKNHFTRYPLMQVDDFYKLAHQAALGSEHAVTNLDAARAWLESELAEMGSGPVEPMLDAISGDGCVMRIHLRPYLQAGYPLQELLESFLDTANRFEPDYASLRQNLDALLAAAQSGAIGFQVEQLSSYFDRMAESGWPAVHHSPQYLQAYRPAYRVIAREFLPPVIRG